MRIVTALLGLFVSTLALVGCSTTPPAADGRQHAECTVCKHNADLACVDVVVEKDTPHTDYNGHTYYFCSEGCCKAFQKAPGTYVKP